MSQVRHRGRPTLPDGIARDRVIRVRLTRAERDSVKEHADLAGVTVSEFVRGLLPDALPRCVKCDERPRLDGGNYCRPCTESWRRTLGRFGV